jgi:hypothetical protein
MKNGGKQQVGKNKKENITFTLLMCCGMVLIMSLYNCLLNFVTMKQLFSSYLKAFIPALIVAVLWEMLVVIRIAKPIFLKHMHKISNPKRRPLFMSLLMVTGMVLGMTFFGMLLNTTLDAAFVPAYLVGAALNFVVALPVQIFLVSPVVRRIFVRMFPPATPRSSGQPAQQ